ncbi:hypothetical protein EHF33_14645 [Deinococcus psychrotolerans]|uniref:Spore coat protein U domain-containing protein n=1 Tax=Deinococcus psychrotolerans TaxID=2489213 RepID=A0A3G8YR05_9DEIO|nr:hypothetical protein [Deinococcus psychrotolerans]AZI44141.1 hypothetical protein EHF33_14645 [Deinococcus psychrotolerans]
MRLHLILPTAALLLTSLAFAANTSTPVPVNSTVLNSCVFTGGPATIAIPTYKAAEAQPQSGQTDVSVLCNTGTQPFTTYWANEPDLSLALTAGNGDVLNVALGYGEDPTTPTTGPSGGDVWIYTLTATPLPGQYGASSQNNYTNTADYIVAF